MKYSLKFLKTGNTYDVMPNIKLVEKLSTELNMYESTLSTLDKPLNLDFKETNGLTAMQLIMRDENKKETIDMYMTYYHQTKVAYNPERYKYVIQATSPTFKLQRIVLPNKLITQPIKGAKKTLYGEIQKIMEVYAPEIEIDPLLKNVKGMQDPSPEMQFTKSTLHEVLIGLFAAVKLCPTMKEFNKLSYFYLNGNPDKNWNSSDIFIREEKENAVADYSDMIDMDIENAISKDEDIATAWIPTTSDEVVLTTENFYWQTPSEIYDIKQVELLGKNITFSLVNAGGNAGTAQSGDLDNIALDITDWVVSKEIYNTLKTSSALSIKDKDYKRNNLYYEGNKITGGAYNEDTWFGGGLLPAINNVVTLALEKIFNVGIQVVTNIEIEDVREIALRVIYKSENDNTRIKIIREGVETPVNALINNQDDAYIDTINFGNAKQEQINRLGNQNTTGQANYDLKQKSFKNSPQVGERVDGRNVISERETLMKENTMIANYKLAKDYAIETGYAGLKQLKRFTQIDRNGTLIRNDNFLYNFKLDTKDAGTENYLINKFIDNYAEKTTGVCLHYFRPMKGQVFQTSMLLMASQNKHIGNSIVCQLGFNDNFIAGNRTKHDKKKTLMQPVRYTDENGEFEKACFYFGGGEEQRNQKNFHWIESYPEAYFQLGTLPSSEYLLYKDTREISSFTFQFRMVGNGNTFIYNDFYRYTQLTTHEKQDLKVYVLYNKDSIEGYTPNTILPLGEYYEEASVIFGKKEDNTEERSITIKNVLLDVGFYAIGVTDSNNNLLFAVNYENNKDDTFIKLWINEII